MSTHFASLSAGKRACDFIESNSIPANVRVVAGPHVFSDAIVAIDDWRLEIGDCRSKNRAETYTRLGTECPSE